MKKICIVVLIHFLFLSCEEPVAPFEPEVDPAFAGLIQKFVDEGAQRGVNLSTSDLEALLVNEFSQQVGGGGFCGYGWWTYPGRGNPRMEIRETGPCWTDRTDLEKENLVFHELGHSLLERLHTNATLPNGTTPKSLMCGDGFCSNYQTFFADGPLRSYYLDELFDPQTPFPNTFLDKQFSRIVFQEDFENYDGSWEQFNIRDNGTVKQYTVTDESGSLVITNPSAITDSAEIIVLKRFDLVGFADCSNLKTRANLRTEGMTNGSFSMAVSFRERKPNGDLERFFLDFKKQESFTGGNDTFANFESEAYCLPAYTDVVTISFRIYSPTPASVFVDDVVLELWE